MGYAAATAYGDLVSTGTAAANRDFIFAQWLGGTLAPKSNSGSGGTSNSAMIRGAGNGTSDNRRNRRVNPSIDASARVLIGGSFGAGGDEPNYSIHISRLEPNAPADLIFDYGIE